MESNLLGRYETDKVAMAGITDVSMTMNSDDYMFFRAEFDLIPRNNSGIAEKRLCGSICFDAVCDDGWAVLERILDVVGVENFSKLPGTIVRVRFKSLDKPAAAIGHCRIDRWFDIEFWQQEVYGK